MAKARAKKRAIRDGERVGSSEDEYTAVSSSLWARKGSDAVRPPVGSFEECAKCETQFTVVCIFHLVRGRG